MHMAAQLAAGSRAVEVPAVGAVESCGASRSVVDAEFVMVEVMRCRSLSYEFSDASIGDGKIMADG